MEILIFVCDKLFETKDIEREG